MLCTLKMGKSYIERMRRRSHTSRKQHQCRYVFGVYEEYVSECECGAFECVCFSILRRYICEYIFGRGMRSVRGNTSRPISKRMIVHYHFNNMRDLNAKYASSNFTVHVEKMVFLNTSKFKIKYVKNVCKIYYFK